jgi:dihydrofolate reductase
MAKISVFIHLTLDGVMQSPGGPEEDPRGGFPYGGWAKPYGDKVLDQVVGAGMKKDLELLFGHFTYSAFHAYWPHQKNNPFTDVLNNTQKFVVSRTHAKLPWESSTLLEGDAASTVGALKKQHDKDLLILGSGELVQSLMKAKLIDELLLTINPIVLGQGKKLFPDGGAFAKLELVDSKISTKGVVIATYRPAS